MDDFTTQDLNQPPTIYTGIVDDSPPIPHDFDNSHDFDLVKDMDPPPHDELMSTTPEGDQVEEDAVPASRYSPEKLLDLPPEEPQGDRQEDHHEDHHEVEEHESEPPAPDSSVQIRTSNPFLCFVVSLYHSKHVNDLLLWKNIPLSAGALILFIYTAFSMALMSMLSVIGYYGLGIIVCNVAIRLYRNILEAIGKQQAVAFFPVELVDRMSEATWELPRECVLKAVGKACDSFNGFAGDLRDIVFVRSYSRTLKAAVLLYFLTWIGSTFNLLTLVIIVVLNLFYIPLLFAKFDKEIHTAVMKFRDHYKQTVKLVVEKVPFLARFCDDKVKTS